ncbi:MAG: hypothetical protein AAF736_02830, partial [Pseudomonadota bacterium]
MTVRSSRAILARVGTRAATALKGAAQRIAQLTHRSSPVQTTGHPSSEPAFPGVPGSRRQWLTAGVILLVLPLLSL